MAYEKQTFTDGEILTAEQLNHIENGLSDLQGRISSVSTDLARIGITVNSSLIPRVTDLETDVPKLDQRATNLETDVSELDQRATTLETDVSELGRRATELESNIWTAGYDTVDYGSSDGFRIEDACLNNRPVYCKLTDEELTPYYFPLMEWDRYTQTAAFGGCYGDKLVNITYVNGGWSKSETPITEHPVFVGDENTPIEKFTEAYNSGKKCFLYMERETGSPVVYNIDLIHGSVVHLYRTTGSGLVEHGYLTSSGLQNMTVRSYVEEITETSTHGNIPTAKAVYDIFKNTTDKCSVFVGDDNTTVAEYLAAYQAEKVCFMRRRSGPVYLSWVLIQIDATNAYFYYVDRYGVVHYGNLTSAGAWNQTQVRTVKTVNGVTPAPDGNVNVTLTDEQIGQIVDRVIETMPTWTGGSY